ncbi:hypothetical protein V3W47_18360 [Deinococcus sp. YIM 134068]|uniref:hypothetical protein n=1 Tax=Deinococcus lichenicola TaxID=3118910 RepID=UPI002F921F69
MGPFNLLLLNILCASLLVQALACALGMGWGMTLGLLLLGGVAGRVCAPLLRAHEGRRMAVNIVQGAAVLASLFNENRTADALCLVLTLVMILTIWEDEGPRLRRRWSRKLEQRGFRFTRPVISAPSAV